VKKSYRSILSIGLLSVLVVSLVFMLTGCGLFGSSPTANIETDPPVQDGKVSVDVDDVVEFDGSNSEPSTTDGEITTYEWTFDDEFNSNSPAGDAVQTGSYDTAGDYEVELKVTDDVGKTDKASVDVEVSS